MRIIAGDLKGRTLQAPKGTDTRPTSDRVREALFSHVEATLGGLEGIHVLDAFAGTGALGLEALSRGADSCLFVECDRGSAEILRANIAHCALPESRAYLRVGNSFALAARLAEQGPFDLILLDPPYITPAAEVIRFVEALKMPGAYVVYEHQQRQGPSWPACYHGLHTARYGKTKVSCAFVR
jgi:16S rRNA (guanine966-N2)-methyltransferase